MLRIGIVAGEASGDLLGANLIGAIKRHIPDAQFEGVAGPRMIEQGCNALFPSDKLSLMGLVEVIGHYREVRGIRAQLLKHFLRNPPHVFVGIDVPDFNLGLEYRLRRAGIPTVQYVSPQVWAWRQYRVRKIARSVDLMLTLFPFEAAFYEAQPRHRVPVRFVGHPLADAIPLKADENPACKAALRESLGLSITAEVVALLPGSRASELHYLADAFIQIASWCKERRPELCFIAPLLNHTTRALFEQALARQAVGFPVQIVEGRSHDVLRAADVVLSASGTATLEALLFKRPMVVAYRVAALTAWIARRIVKIPYFSLPNLLAGRELVREFSQEAVTPENVGEAVLALFEQPQSARDMCALFTDIHHSLRQDAGEQAANAILALARPYECSA